MVLKSLIGPQTCLSMAPWRQPLQGSIGGNREACMIEPLQHQGEDSFLLDAPPSPSGLINDAVSSAVERIQEDPLNFKGVLYAMVNLEYWVLEQEVNSLLEAIEHVRLIPGLNAGNTVSTKNRDDRCVPHGLGCGHERPLSICGVCGKGIILHGS